MDEKNPGTPFVMLTSPRSGSTWLVSVLNQLERTTVYGELFIGRKRSPNAVEWADEFAYPRFVEVRPKGIAVRPFSTFSYLDTLYRKPGTVGFKLMYSQLNRFRELWLYLFFRRVRILHLVRRNSLDMLISQAIRRKMQRAHRLAGEPAPVDIQVELNPPALIRRLEAKQKKLASIRTVLRNTRLPVLEVAYEDLVTDLDVFQSVCKFLAIPSIAKLPTSRLAKIRQRDQAHVVRNYSAVREALSGTPYAGFLD